MSAPYGPYGGSAAPDAGASAFVEAMRGRLLDLVGEVLLLPEVRDALVRVERGPQLLETEAAARADDLLDTTTPELSRLQQAEQRLADLEPTGAAAVPGITAAGALAALGGQVLAVAALVAMAAGQVAVWRHLGAGRGIVVTVVALLGAAAVVGLSAAVERVLGAGVGAESRLALAALVLVVDGYGFLFWVHWAPYHRKWGAGAYPVWAVAGLFALFLAGIAAAVYSEGANSRSAFPGLAGPVYRRSLAVALTLAAVTGAVWHWRSGLPPADRSVRLGVVLVAATVTVLGVGAAVLEVARDPGTGTTRVPLRRAVQAVRQAQAEWEAAARERAILPFVRNRINEILEPGFSLTLSVFDTSGLRQMRSQKHVVPTRTFERFGRRMADLGGGAVGLAGPRGAGKTTLLEAYGAGAFLEPGQQPHLSLMESVPVRYQAQDFMLHLHARLCEQVIEFATAAGGDTRRAELRRALAHRLAVPAGFVAAWTLAAVVGHVVIEGRGDELVAAGERYWWPGAAVAGAVGVAALVLRGRAGAPPSLDRAPPRPRTLAELAEYARQQLFDVRFQQRFTAGWGGKVTLPFSSELSRSRSREVVRAVRSYPEIVHGVTAFLDVVLDVLDTVPDLPAVRIVVIVDELDKMQSAENARTFLNELKGLFTAGPGCLFLVSVSEDALASFEQRGLPVRDVFDSAFDEVFRVDFLTLQDTYSILRSRVIGLPEVFLALCHCLSGGLPREVVRVARDVAAHRDRTAPAGLGQVARSLVLKDLGDKVSGLRAILGRAVSREPYASDLMRHLDAALRDVSGAGLLAAAGQPPIVPAEAERAALEDVLVFQAGALGYLYHGATMLEVFSDELTEGRFATARDGTDDGSFDALASVRQQFGVNARLAWLTLSAFRVRWGLTPLDPPR